MMNHVDRRTDRQTDDCEQATHDMTQ